MPWHSVRSSHSACSTTARVATLVIAALAHVSLRADASIQDLVTAAGTGSQGFGFTGKATATYYGGGLDGGNCGFGNILAAGYGPLTAAGSVMLYKDGHGCGSCYRVRCVDSPYCKKGVSVTVTIADQCPAGGGWCCPSCVHFDLNMASFNLIAEQVAGHIPLVYTRVPCAFNRNIRLTPTGSDFWINLLVRNVAGPGDLASVHVAEAGSATWKPMEHDWGAVWVHRTCLKSPLRFRLTSLMDGQVVETPGPCLPAGWVAGKDYDCQVQFSGGGGGGGGGAKGGGGGGGVGGWGGGGGGGNGGGGNSTGGNNGWSGGGESEGNSGILPPKNMKTPPPKGAAPPKKVPPGSGQPNKGNPKNSPPSSGQLNKGSPKKGSPPSGQPNNGNFKKLPPSSGQPNNGSPKKPLPPSGKVNNGTKAKKGSPKKTPPAPGTPKNGTTANSPPKKTPPAPGTPKNGTTANSPPKKTPLFPGKTKNGTMTPSPPSSGAPLPGKVKDGGKSNGSSPPKKGPPSPSKMGSGTKTPNPPSTNSLFPGKAGSGG
ncbi:unnamed protein product [Closterium sp. Naga37s-1]|nr:unnamed protein product [Closterium sp. Naga37s-1]CAI5522742.1 unnamed protein product [Closterium sp. Naga37s-1]